MSSVGIEIQNEIKRNYELLDQYKSIGPMRSSGANLLITADLDFAHEALKENDVVKILQAYERLKGNK